MANKYISQPLILGTTTMNKRHFLSIKALLPIVAILFANAFTLQAQTPPCSFDEHHQALLKADPEYQLNLDKLEANFQNHLRKSKKDLKAGIATVPVVVHVIHIGEAEGAGSNIPVEQIESMISGNNVYFRNQKADGSVFNPNGQDLEIEFCLAKTDPNGNPTEGIVRVDGRSVTNYETQGIVDGAGGNEQQVKALSKWDNKKYYNIWVVHKINGQNFRASGGTAGYAYFPGAGANVDGTVIHVLSSGYDPDGSKGFDLVDRTNSTIVHELGHAFSIYHTFEGGGNSPGGACPPAETTANCSTKGDRICDTDPHVGDLGRCRSPGDANACTGGVYDLNIASNIMNYTNCDPLLFTPDQKTRFRATVEPGGGRYSLTQQSSCQSPLDYDIAITKVTQPNGLYCSTTVTAEFSVQNKGLNPITSFDYEYGIGSTVLGTATYTGNLAPQASDDITTTPIVVPTGTQNFFVRVVPTSINGSNLDERSSNDEGNTTFETITGEIITISVIDYATGDNFQLVDEFGSTIFNVTLSDGGSSYTQDFCVYTDRCYDFTFTDLEYIPTYVTYGGVPGKVPTFEIKNELGLTVSKGFDALPPFSGGIKPISETDNFCLPYDPGFIVADFTADRFIVPEGTSIQFTDLSAGTGSGANDWSWVFQGNGTSTAKNPVKSYPTAGNYDVELTADNGLQPDTRLKKNFIKVVKDITACGVISNFLTGGDIPKYNTLSGSFSGTLGGINSENILSYADVYLATNEYFVKSVDIFVTSQSIIANPDSVITIKIYGNSANKPGTVIASKTVALSDLTIGNYTNVVFTTPVKVNDFYYAGFTLPSPANGDTVVVGTAAPRGADDFSNSTYIFRNSVWRKQTDIFGQEYSSALGLKINVAPESEAKIAGSTFATCAGAPIDFDGTPSINANIYRWVFTGASPNASTSSKPSGITWATEGVKTVKLFVKKGTCGVEDSLTFTVTVNSEPVIAVDVINESCGRADGKAIASGTGGSGSYSYDWSTLATGDKISGLTAGSYDVIWSDNVCGSGGIITFTVDNDASLSSPTGVITNTSCGLEDGDINITPVGGTGTYTYTWTTASDPTFMETTKNLTDVPAGTYTVVVDNLGCLAPSTDFTIAPSTSVTASSSASPSTICSGDSTDLIGTGGALYLWTNLSGDTISQAATVRVAPEESDYFILRASNPDGCYDDELQFIEVVPSPILIAGVDSVGNGKYHPDSTTVDIKDGGIAYFTSVGSLAQQYVWDFGDGATSNNKNPQHIYVTAGIYKVTLTLTTESCTRTKEMQVRVLDNSSPSGISSLNASKITVYPNPVSNSLNVSIPENAELIISDISGKVLLKQYVNTGVNQIDLSGAATGQYILKIVGEHTVFTHSIIKTK